MKAFLHAAWVIASTVIAMTLPATAADKTITATMDGGVSVVHETIKGDDTIRVRVTGKAGEKLAVALTTSNRQAYFNVLPPGGGEALFIGSTSGDRFEGVLKDDGTYEVQAYLMRAAARRKETAKLSLKLTLSGAPVTSAGVEQPAAAAAGTPFQSRQTLMGVSFDITSPNTASGNSVTIAPKGLLVDNQPMTQAVAGTIIKAEAGDINVDGSPEIYLMGRSADADQRGILIAYSANALKSLSTITLPPLTSKQAKGYRGHDEFAVVENSLARRFPLYGTDGKATGKMRQVQYKLARGEATWKLTVKRVDDF